MEKKKISSALTSEKDIMGFRLPDLVGIAIMIIPFIISIQFNHIDPAKTIWFIQITAEKETNIRPGLISALLAAIFYASLIVRYPGIFTTQNLIEVIISSVRAFLNCWCIAALISTVVTMDIPKNGSTLGMLFQHPGSFLLMLAILLSWLGMRTIAGYSWILFIIAAWKHFLVLNDVMNVLGAVFILTFAISLFLQVKDITYINDFMRDFRGKASKYAPGIKQDVNAAMSDASVRIHEAEEFVTGLVRENSSGLGIRIPSTPDKNLRPEHTKLNLAALDANQDGVVDDKDIVILASAAERRKNGEEH